MKQTLGMWLLADKEKPMPEFKKLAWRNVSPRVETVLCDIATNKIVGDVKLKGNWWSATYFGDLASAMMPTCGAYSTEKEAKQAVVTHATFNNATFDKANVVGDMVVGEANVVVMEEPEVLVDIDEAALRNIIAAPDLESAKQIARDVLADPAKWLKDLLAKEPK